MPGMEENLARRRVDTVFLNTLLKEGMLARKAATRRRRYERGLDYEDEDYTLIALLNNASKKIQRSRAASCNPVSPRQAVTDTASTSLVAGHIYPQQIAKRVRPIDPDGNVFDMASHRGPIFFNPYPGRQYLLHEVSVATWGEVYNWTMPPPGPWSYPNGVPPEVLAKARHEPDIEAETNGQYEGRGGSCSPGCLATTTTLPAVDTGVQGPDKETDNERKDYGVKGPLMQQPEANSSESAVPSPSGPGEAQPAASERKLKLKTSVADISTERSGPEGGVPTASESTLLSLQPAGRDQASVDCRTEKRKKFLADDQGPGVLAVTETYITISGNLPGLEKEDPEASKEELILALLQHFSGDSDPDHEQEELEEARPGEQRDIVGRSHSRASASSQGQPSPSHEQSDQPTQMPTEEVKHKITEESSSGRGNPQDTIMDTDSSSSPDPVSPPPFPEHGPPIVLHRDRLVCAAHLKSVCRSCGIDYAGLGLLPLAVHGLSSAEIETVLNFRDASGYAIPILTCRPLSPFLAGLDAADRATEYPTLTEHDRNLFITYDRSDPRAVAPLFGPNARFAPKRGADADADADTDALGSPTACAPCELTFLGGAAEHPSHHGGYSRAEGGTRAVVVWADGAFTPACGGTRVAGARRARGGVGVHCGPDSRYNVSERFERGMFALADGRNGGHPGVVLTKTTVALGAVATALTVVRERVVGDWRAAVARALEGAPGCSGQAVRAAERFTVVLCVDAADVVDIFCRKYPWQLEVKVLTKEIAAVSRKAERIKAKLRKKRHNKVKKEGEGGEDEEGEGGEDAAAEAGAGPTSRQSGVDLIAGHVSWEKFVVDKRDEKVVVVSTGNGRVVPDSDGIVKVVREIALLSKEGVVVQFYLIPAKANVEADRLAKAGMDFVE